MGPRDDLGRSSPLGAALRDGGVNFSLYSRSAARVDLLFFDREEDAKPSRIIGIEPRNRTYHYWHTFVPGARGGSFNGSRVSGPINPPPGVLLKVRKVLLIPYAPGVVKRKNKTG